MKPETTEDILELMNGSIYSAVVGTAMELDLFWLLADKPLPAAALAQHFNMPLNRCHYWLQILCKLGLLEDRGEGYAPSEAAREAILNVQSQGTWASPGSHVLRGNPFWDALRQVSCIKRA